MTALLFATGTVLIVSCLCSLLEAALYSLPTSQIELLASQGRSSGKILRAMKENIQRPISAILSLNTLANTGGAAIAGAAFAGVYQSEDAEVYFTGALALSVLIFSEIIPKTAGVIYARSLGTYIAHPIQWLIWLFTPFIWLNQFVTGLITRGASDTQDISAQEIEIIARMGRQAGAIGLYQEKAISNILNLQPLRARDIMTPRTVVFSRSRQQKLAQVRAEIQDWHYSRVPLYDEDKDQIVGHVLRRDIIGALADGRDQACLADFQRPVGSLPELARVGQVLNDFLERRKHIFILVDEYGVFSGLVTLEDIIEEIVGAEIFDETDVAVDMQEQARQRRRRITDSDD
ncbi:MAG: DUF21 domain-containing protein [Candidatus Latescibacteria bacterium]|nr:DUF21 domain-containing protein [Candidatus Latescibacterota bacterium]